MHDTRIDIPAKARTKLVETLNARLADALDLTLQAKQAHWNVKGPNFIQFHELFDELAPHFDEAADLIAERITALGGVANGTTRQAAASSSIPEYDLSATEGLEHVRALSERLAKFGNQVREDIDRADELGDTGTTDLLTGVSRQADKDLWFLEAHLQK